MLIIEEQVSTVRTHEFCAAFKFLMRQSNTPVRTKKKEQGEAGCIAQLFIQSETAPVNLILIVVGILYSSHRLAAVWVIVVL